MMPEYLLKILRYDPETGKMHWRERDESTSKKHRWFNSRYAGKEAMTSRKDSGHLSGPISGKTLMAHRVAWAIHYGEWPTGWIDHINGIRDDNRICNLRIANPEMNAKNRRPNAHKASSLPHGVSQKNNGRYFAQIQVCGKNHHLGYFMSPEKAAEAYRNAKEIMGFHENHGRQPSALIAKEQGQ